MKRKIHEFTQSHHQVLQHLIHNMLTDLEILEVSSELSEVEWDHIQILKV